MVRSMGAPRSVPLTSADEVCDWLTRPDSRALPAEVLSLAGGVAELGAWLGDRRPYNNQHAQGWESARDDLLAALDRLGPRTAASIGPHLTVARTSIGRLPDAAVRKAASADLDALSRRLKDQNVAVAALTDLFDAVSGLATAADTVAAYRDLFLDLIELSGRDTQTMANMIAGVCDDHAIGVTAARVRVGEIDRPSRGSWPKPNVSAGLSIEDRFELAGRLVATADPRGKQVVWLAFDRASTESARLEIGPITFFYADWVRGNLEGGPLRGELPSELVSADGLPASASDIPEGTRVVLARVDLGIGVAADAVNRARHLAEAVVGLASFRSGREFWIPMQGYLHAVDDQLVARGSFSRALDVRDISSWNDRTDAELRNLTPQLAPILPLLGPELSEVVEALHWWQNADEHTSAGILLNVRIIELLASRAGFSKWYDLIDAMKTRWIRVTIRRVLLELLDDATYYVPIEALIDPASAAQIESLRAGFVTVATSGGMTYDLDRGVGDLPTLASMYVDHYSVGRRIREVAAHLSDPTSLEAWIHSLEKRWLLAQARLRRIRNAVAHGGPFTKQGVLSVADFGRQLAAWSLATALEACLNGSPFSVQLAQSRRASDNWRAAVPAARSVSEALFGS